MDECVIGVFMFVLFKQKTAYDLRISDWSSDVCSSDLIWTPGCWAVNHHGYYWVPGAWVLPPYTGALWTPGYWGYIGNVYQWHPGYWGRHRSEEHTSELQSLMRISYAVFCLKKQKTQMPTP